MPSDRRWSDTDRELVRAVLHEADYYDDEAAGAVLDALTAAGKLRENAATDIETAFRGRLNDTSRPPLHRDAAAAYQHAIAIARGATDE